MENPENKKSEIERTGEDLFNFAVDREDVKWLMDRLPPETDVKRTTVEYELQIFTFMTGSKIFISTTSKVKQYLEAIKLR